MGAGKIAHVGILDLVGAVYDAALDETLWSSLAPRIARAFDSTSSAVQMRDVNRGRIDELAVTANYDQATADAYVSYYGQRDVWLERAAAMGSHQVLASKDLIAHRDFERTEFYNDFIRARNVFYVVGAAFPVAREALCVIGIQRPRDGRPYEEEDKALAAKFRRDRASYGVIVEPSEKGIDRVAIFLAKARVTKSPPSRSQSQHSPSPRWHRWDGENYHSGT